VPDLSVQLLSWQFSEVDDLSRVASSVIDLGVGSHAQLDAIELAHANGSGPIRVHLKIDTGLNRNGVAQPDWHTFIARAVALELVDVVTVVGVWTHIAETSDEADARACREFNSARVAVESACGRPLFAHLAASSASFRLAEFRFDAVRVGGHAYGIPSFDGVSPSDMGLVPVMTLTSTVVADYDEEWGDVAVVSGGFTDGIPGYAASRVAVTIDGVRHPILAVREDETIALGSPSGSTAYFFGNGNHGEQTVREWGDAMSTLGDEVTCRVSPIVPRRIID
jgi:alanine racemase